MPRRADDHAAGPSARRPDFEFSLKLYQKFTHPGDVPQGDRDSDPVGARRQGRRRVPRARIDPLASAGKLGALLAQFPASFKNEPNVARLPGMAAATRSRTIRWRSSCGTAAGATIPTTRCSCSTSSARRWSQIDEPKFRFSIRQNLLPNVKTFYYMRLHGRNAAQWWKHDKSEDRYNYLYSATSWSRFVEAAEEASREVKKAYLYTNNHFSAKSVANAAMIKHKLGQPLDGRIPAGASSSAIRT